MLETTFLCSSTYRWSIWELLVVVLTAIVSVTELNLQQQVVAVEDEAQVLEPPDPDLQK